MGYYRRDIQDEYDDDGNYIGDSAEGNRFHGLIPLEPKPPPTHIRIVMRICFDCKTPSPGFKCPKCSSEWYTFIHSYEKIGGG